MIIMIKLRWRTLEPNGLLLVMEDEYAAEDGDRSPYDNGGGGGCDDDDDQKSKCRHILLSVIINYRHGQDGGGLGAGQPGDHHHDGPEGDLGQGRLWA